MTDLDVRIDAIAAAPAAGEARARTQLRAQIALLERRLSEALADGVPASAPAGAADGPRLLGLGDLERVRDDLAARLADAHGARRERAEGQDRARVRLERMLLHPGRHRFERVAQAELGEGGCGVWQVRPRLGLIGMLMGWWQVKLSSGCPLPGRRPSGSSRRAAP